jgi:hypothetical protein
MEVLEDDDEVPVAHEYNPVDEEMDEKDVRYATRNRRDF